MIKTIIFDCFGVLYWDELSRLYNLVKPVQYEALNDIIHATDHGYITRQDFLDQVSELSGVSADAVAAVLHDKQRRNDDIIDRIRQLKPAFKIGLLSNMGPDTLDTLFTVSEREELFDDVLISSEVGLIKPSRDLYELALERLGSAADETIFIDDRAVNIDGAKLVGIKTILFASNEQFEQELALLTTNVHA